MTSLAVDTLRRLSSDLSVFTDGRDIPEDVLDSFIVSMEFVYRELIVLETTAQLSPIQCQATEIVRSCLSRMRSLYELRNMRENNPGFQVTSVLTGMVGRPRLEVSYEQLSFLIENRFSVPQIADMVGVSVRTIRRRMSECGLSIQAQYASITDSELDTMVSEVQRQFPMCGNRQMQGHLLSRGYRVQQNRIRESQRRVDPEGAIIRRLHVLNRREYSVPSPRSLYHIDGHHKLIRYKCSAHLGLQILQLGSLPFLQDCIPLSWSHVALTTLCLCFENPSTYIDQLPRQYK